MNYTIKSQNLTVTISSLGAELISAVGKDGYEYIWQNETGEFWGGHAPLLFPHCARILNSEYTYGGKTYQMNSHGFARKSEFTLENLTDDSVTLYIESTELTKESYPFDFKLVAEYRVNDETLDASYTVMNTDNTTLPYMFGWHPGFNLDCSDGEKIGEFSIKFNNINECLRHPLQNNLFVSPIGEKYSLADSIYRLDEEEIYSNDTMIFVGTGNIAELVSPSGRHGLTLTYSENLPYFCIWKYPSDRAKYICLEPWSDVPGDGITPENFETKKMSRLPKGETATYSYSVKFNT